jgi:putative transposase
MAIIPNGPESIREHQNNKPLEIKDQEMFDKMLEYIHMNPVMAGFVIKPEDWKYSSARDSSAMQGLIDLSYSS